MNSLMASLKRLAVVLGSASLISCGGGAQNSDPVVYTALFDAGSSGTRLTFYRVIPNPGGYPSIDHLGTFDEDIDGVVNDDGINDFLNGSGGIKLSGEGLPTGCPRLTSLGSPEIGPCLLQPLLAQLDLAVAAENVRVPGLNLQRNQVKVELFATAGMRTEEAGNGGKHTKAAISSFYGIIKAYVTGWGYDVGEFKTVNGNSEEGIWSWVNLNDYYYNVFGGNPTKTRVPQSPVGDVEVGGSSMQIAFPTDEPTDSSANIYKVTLNGKSFQVFSKTYLGLGADDTRKYVKAIGYSQQDGGAPCYATTATSQNTREASSVGLYPSSDVVAGPYPFPDNALLGSPWFVLDPSKLLLKQPAVFDFGQCAKRFDTIISQVAALPRNRWGTDPGSSAATMESLKLRVKNSKAPFVGIAGFYFPASDLGQATPTGFDSTQFKSRLEAYCSGPVADRGFAQNVCPNATFMYEFLYGPLGLFYASPAVFAGVRSTKDNGETALTWTRGYLLLRYSAR